MAGDPLWINAATGAPSYTANELRQAMALGLMYGGRLVGARQGVRPGGDQMLTTLVSTTITVKAGVALVDPALSTPQGPYWVALPLDETFTLTAADATNPRKDITILRVYDDDEDSSGNRFARSEYLVGTPNPAPVEPAVPAGAFRLATIDVPAQGGGSASVTDRRPWTVAPGGILPVADSSAVTGAHESLYRDRRDLDLLERYSGSAWETAADPAMFKPWTTYTPTWTTTGTAPSVGNGSLTGAFLQLGKLVFVRIVLTVGSTTTFGSGAWRFSLPIGGQVRSVLPVVAVDVSSFVDYAGVAHLITIAATGDNMRIAFQGTRISATVPMTWVDGDVLSIDGSYEAS